MNLILIRHARAFERDPAAWPDDSRRPLTATGREQFRVLAKRLGRAVREVEIVESSGFVRAWQTAQVLAEETNWPSPSRFEGLEGEADDATIEALVRSVAAMRDIGTAVWVGHEPVLSRLASRLLSGRADGMRIDFKKGAAVALRIPKGAIEAGGAELLWMFTPRAVARMRKD